MFKEFAPVLHQAEDQIKFGLDNLSDREVKDTYNALISIQIELYRRYLSSYVERLGINHDEA